MVSRIARRFSPPPATGEPLDDGERWPLDDLPDADRILYRSWEELVLHRLQVAAGIVFGFIAALSPWVPLAAGAVIAYVVIDLMADAVSLRGRGWIDRTPMDAGYTRRWLSADRWMAAYALTAMIAIVVVRFA